MAEAEVRARRCLKAAAASIATRLGMIALVIVRGPFYDAVLVWSCNLPAIILALVALWNGAIASHLAEAGRKPVLGCTLAVVSALASFVPPFAPIYPGLF